MIGCITGRLEFKDTHSLLLDVNGIGYEIEAPLSTLFELPEIGQTVKLHTHFVVREDAQLLYGFMRKSDRDMFRVLIKVNGVGPKLGIAILSGLDSASLARCVEDDDVSTLVKLPGIGKKTAERLLIELRDKVKVTDAGDGASSGASASVTVADMEEEAESALLALGYKPQDASKAVKHARHDGQTLESLVKSALKAMM